MNFKDMINSGKSIKEALEATLFIEFNTKSLDERVELSSKVFNKLYADLRDINRLDKDSITELLEGIKSAIVKDEEERLYSLLYESEKINKEIKKTGYGIKNAIFDSFKDIEDSIKSQNSLEKDILLSIVNETLVGAAQLKGIIKEVSESVFLSIIESGDDIEDTAFEFSKNLVYKSLNESEFKRYHATAVAKTILGVALSVANESKIYTSELIGGTVRGINAGTLKAIDKFKDGFKFAPEELGEEFSESLKEIAGIDEEYRELFKALSASTEDPARSELEAIIKKEYDNPLSKIVKISADAAASLKDNFELMELSENYKEFSKFATAKFDEIKKKGAKIWGDLELDDKISGLKKDIDEIDKKLRSRFSKKESTEELASRAYEASKDRVKESKEQKEESKQ